MRALKTTRVVAGMVLTVLTMMAVTGVMVPTSGPSALAQPAGGQGRPASAAPAAPEGAYELPAPQPAPAPSHTACGTPAPTIGTAYYVGPNGSDSNACAQARSGAAPKKTISAALKCLKGGDTLILKPGVYTESIINMIPPGSSWANPTTLKSETPGQAMIKPSRGNRSVVEISREGDQYIVLDGLVIDGSNSVGARGLHIGRQNQRSPAAHIKVQNTTIRNTRDASCMSTALGTHDISLLNSVVHACKVVSTGTKAARVGAHGIYWHADNSVIQGNEFYDIDGLGMQIYDAKGRSINNVVVRNNYVHDSGHHNARGNPGILFGVVNNGVIENNVVSNTGRVGIDPGAGHNVRVTNNTIYNKNTAIRDPGRATLTGNTVSSASGPATIPKGVGPGTCRAQQR
jgi:hypothetical protein